MKVGITATQEGLTVMQHKRLHMLLHHLKVIELRHGDCIGGDSQAHDIAENMKLRIVIHPPINSNKRAFREGIILPEKEYLSRNKDIVNAVDYMIALPKEREEVLRSGTWSTIRYAKKINKPLYIIYP